jgi:hypothetical protein
MPLDPIELALALPDASAFEQAVLAGLGCEIGFDAAFFLVPGETPAAVALDPEHLGAALNDGRYDEETLPLRVAAQRSHGVVVDTDVLGERRVRSMRYHRDLAAPIGGKHSLLAYLHARGRAVGVVMLGRTGRSFNEREISGVRTLASRIAIARVSYGIACADEPLPEGKASIADQLSRALTGSVIRERAEQSGQRVLVRDVGDEREMVAQRGPFELVWTRLDRREPRRSSWFYVELFQLALARARFRRRALFIGSGGGAAVRQFRSLQPSLRIDVVELDAEVLRMANTWFGLTSLPNVCAVVADGAQHIAAARDGTWDVLVLDAYGAAQELPKPFACASFWDDASRVLCPGGALAVNVIGALDGGGAVASVMRLLERRFEHVRAVPVVDAGDALERDAVRNVVVLASCSVR